MSSTDTDNPLLSTTGRAWAYTGLGLGAGVSTAANILFTYVPPLTAPPSWPTGRPWDPAHYAPPAGAVVGGAFWPLGLFISSEIMARVEWPSGWRWMLTRAVALVMVAAVTAAVSYHHLSGLLYFYNESSTAVRIGPLAIDGLMLMSTAALQAISHQRRAALTGSTPTGSPVPARRRWRGSRWKSSPVTDDQPPPVSADVPLDTTGEPVDSPSPVDAAVPGPRRPVDDPPVPVTADTVVPVGAAASLPVGVTAPVDASPRRSVSTPRRPTVSTGSRGKPRSAREASFDGLTDGQIIEQALVEWPHGPFTANQLRTEFGIGTPRATRLRDFLSAKIVAEAAAAAHDAVPVTDQMALTT